MDLTTTRRLVLVSLVGLLAAGSVLTAVARSEPAESGEEAYFPPPETTGGWRTLVSANETPSDAQKARIREVAGLDWDRMNDAWKYCESFGGPSSVVVIRRGWIAGEWFSFTNLRGIASCTKSLTGLSVAKLCEMSAAGEFDKPISFDAPAWKYLPLSWSAAEPRRKAIAISHMLTMSSGLDPYDGPYQDLDAYAETIVTRRVEAEPGTVWAYASAPVDLLSLVVESVSGQLLGDFFNEQISRPIGAAPVEFPQFRGHSGGSGGPKGGARVPPRDLARIGYLLLHEGRWRDESGEKRVLTPETVKGITRWAPQLKSATFRMPNLGSPGKEGAENYYGYLFWTNRTHRPLGKAVPADAFYMSGWGKQTCCVIPSLDMVVVRLGPHRELNNHPEYFSEFLSRIVSAVVEEPPSQVAGPAEPSPDGWRALPLVAGGKIAPEWKHLWGGGFSVMDDGSLRTDCDDRGMGLLLYTRERFGHCRIRVVYRSEDARSNAGVYVRVDEGVMDRETDPLPLRERDSRGRLTKESLQRIADSSEAQREAWYPVHHGYEVQICEVGDKYHRTGAIYSLAPAAAAPEKPPTEWKTMIITLQTNEILVDVDGKRLTKFDPDSLHVPERKHWSEPRREPKRPLSGYIGLQNHDPGDIVYFKEVSVRPLPEGAEPQ